MEENETGNALKCSKQSSKKKYNRERTFASNQYSKGYVKKVKEDEQTSSKRLQSVVVSQEEKQGTVSSKKVVEVPAVESKEIIEGYRLMDMSTLHTLISLLLCPECKNASINIGEDPLKKKGLASCIEMKCTNCCKHQHIPQKGWTILKVNTRSIYAMRRCGGGHKHLETFCDILNMPPPMTQKNYDSLSEKLNKATEKVAKTSMIQAAVELKEIEGCDVGVSFDG